MLIDSLIFEMEDDIISYSERFSNLKTVSINHFIIRIQEHFTYVEEIICIDLLLWQISENLIKAMLI
jgi:hypothetical protein